MVTGHIFHCRRNSWPAEEYIGRTALQLLDFDGGAPLEQAWRRRLNSHANILKEFSVTFMEAIWMKALIDPFTKERCKPSASQCVPLGGMGSGSISRGFRVEFKNWHIIPGLFESSPDMENQFSVNQIQTLKSHIARYHLSFLAITRIAAFQHLCSCTL